MDVESSALFLHLPEQIQWNDVLSTALSAAQEQMGVDEMMRLFPRRTSGEDGNVQVTRSMTDQVCER